MASLAAFGAVKAFEHFSPFELRRKGSVEPPKDAKRKDDKKRSKSSKDFVASTNASESSEIERQLSSPMERRRAAPQQLPQLPPAPAPDKLAESQKKVQELEAQVATLSTELAESKSVLDKERKEKAELAVSNAKLKGQVQQMSRTNEKNVGEIAKLQSQLIDAKKTNLEADLSNANGGISVPPPAIPAEATSTVADAVPQPDAASSAPNEG